LLWILALFAIAMFVPNSQTIVAHATKALPRVVPVAMREGIVWVGLGAASFMLVLMAAVNGSRGVSEFIYFNF
jgi:hypothetical protein